MLPGVLFSASIALLVLRTEPHILMFAMLGTIPTALVWWMIGWQGAVVYLVGYFVVRALRRMTA